MSVTCVFGMQWGDEGKGRIVDLLAARSDLVVRYQGGANAGHTVIVGHEKYVLHLLPSGAIQPETVNVIGNGVVVDPWTLTREIDELAERGSSLEGRLFVSDRAHVVLPHHKRMDRALEMLRGRDSLGTTSRGIGPAYGDKARRAGLRVADLVHPRGCVEQVVDNIAAWNAILKHADLEPIETDVVAEQVREVAVRLRPFAADTTQLLLRAWQEDKRILLEGGQGFGLDVDHGSYPYVTSSNTGPAGASAGTGLPPKALTRVLGIAKAYTTRVGAGPFPTRDTGAAGRHLAERGGEFGATTGRPRDCGWFDCVLVRRAARTQGVDALALTKLDVLSGLERLPVCVGYELGGRAIEAPPAHARDWQAARPVYETFEGFGEDVSAARRFDDLPRAAQAYVRALQDLIGLPIEMVSVGAEREHFMRLEGGVPAAA